MSTTTGIEIKGVGTVAVPVADADRARAFYTEKLGFEVRRDATFGPGLRWIEVAPAGATTTVALAPPGPAARTAVDSGIRLTTDDAAGAHAALQAAGVDVDADILRLPGVPPMFSFRDADGNTLYLVENV